MSQKAGMSTSEAKASAQSGIKVTHSYFTSNEFVYYENGKLYDESRNQLDPDVFFELRNNWPNTWREYSK